jgi:hypothetical protein
MAGSIKKVTAYEVDGRTFSSEEDAKRHVQAAELREEFKRIVNQSSFGDLGGVKSVSELAWALSEHPSKAARILNILKEKDQ